MKAKTIVASLLALAAVATTAWQTSSALAGGIEPDSYVVKATLEGVPDGPPKFTTSATGNFYVQIRAGLEPGSHAGKLTNVTPGGHPSCMCPNTDNTCTCQISQISLDRN